MASSSDTPARIRDAALSLFSGPLGPTASVRDIAEHAGVSPALIIRHFGSKQGLREAVDAEVAATIDRLLAEIESNPELGVDGNQASALAVAMEAHLPPGSPIPGYLSWCVGDASDGAQRLLAQIMDASRRAFEAVAEAGLVDRGPDPAVRAAVIAALDLAALTLHRPIGHVMGTTPLTRPGTDVWAREVAHLIARGYGRTP
ncbi:TetR/AcrR family transcriptional regulator [Demequina aestuarii]|uniref:TetR/AcrR family transcriptional regulator n=1 Tax=Demequina aestuarii TaxID=327095 RepID=UPI00078382A2|nr:TetR/AcrR family transcriptional regulator [Demequina aestuarii]